MPKTANYTRKAVDNYKSKKDIVSLTLEKGTRERIEKLTGEKPNEYIYKLLYNALDALEGVTDQKATPKKKAKKLDAVELSQMCENVEIKADTTQDIKEPEKPKEETKRVYRTASAYQRANMTTEELEEYESATDEMDARAVNTRMIQRLYSEIDKSRQKAAAIPAVVGAVENKNPFEGL